MHVTNTNRAQRYDEKGAFARYYTSANAMLPFYPIHWHEEMEIVKVEGNGEVFIDVVKHCVNSSDFVILSPFVMHSINSKAGNMTISAIFFNLRLLQASESTQALQYFAPLLNERSIACVVRKTEGWYEHFEHSFTNILNCDVNKADAQAEICANVQDMLLQLYNNRSNGATTNTIDDKRLYTIRRVLEYIRAEYMNEITIDAISKHCGYSDFYTMKLFKQFADSSIVDYVNNYRLTVAGRQLLNTQDDVATIAYQVGYNNVSYFNRQFKRLYNTTPRKFRSNNN